MIRHLIRSTMLGKARVSSMPRISSISSKACEKRLQRRCHINSRQAQRGEIGPVTGSGGDACHGFPLRHGVQSMEMGGKGGAVGLGLDEEVADGGEDGDEPLQASRRSKALH